MNPFVFVYILKIFVIRSFWYTPWPILTADYWLFLTWATNINWSCSQFDRRMFFLLLVKGNRSIPLGSSRMMSFKAYSVPSSNSKRCNFQVLCECWLINGSVNWCDPQVNRIKLKNVRSNYLFERTCSKIFVLNRERISIKGILERVRCFASRTVTIYLHRFFIVYWNLNKILSFLSKNLCRYVLNIYSYVSWSINFHLVILYILPAVTVNASANCSFHDDVPIRSDAFALCTNLSTVF